MTSNFEELFYEGKELQEDFIELAELATAIKSAVQNNPEGIPDSMKAEYLRDLVQTVISKEAEAEELLETRLPQLKEKALTYTRKVQQAVLKYQEQES